MSYVKVGSQSNDGSRTPTLREYVKSGRKLPVSCGVKIIFLPNKTDSYGLVSDIGFRVSVNSGTELFDTIESELEGWISGDSYLCILPDTDKPGSFELSIDTNESAEWKSEPWGYKLMGVTATKRNRTRKKPTDVSPA